MEVNFNEDSYTVAESDGQVSLSLRINGRFFMPVWAIVEISDGTATGGLCMSLGMNSNKQANKQAAHKLLATVYSYECYV